MGMDKKIERKKFGSKGMITVVILAAVVALVGYNFRQSQAGSTFKIEEQRLNISTVKRGEFQDFIPIRGNIEPLSTVFLDAIEGGRVEQIFVEEGSLVEKGQVILELSNTALQLEVISREAQVSEQLNNLRNTRLAVEQNKVDLKRDLLEVDLEIARAKRALDTAELDYESGFISKDLFDEAKDNHQYHQSIKEVLLETKKQEEEIREAQLQQLENTTDQLEKNLQIARRNLENLMVRAPVDGLLSFLDAEIGQSLDRGERLGQIDDPSNYKVNALVDEYYLARVASDQTATVSITGAKHDLVVEKVYPQVTEGQFQVDLAFPDTLPENLRRGQTLQILLQLGDPTQAVLLNRGGFFQDTGGDWVFALDQDAGYAVKRSVRLGRRNNDYFEVLDGLSPGDRVIVSSYGNFSKMDRIELTR